MKFPTNIRKTLTRDIFALKVPGGREPDSKMVNDKVSDIGTIKTHYQDIHNDISDKHQKKPSKGAFLALKVPGGREPEFCRGQKY